MTGAVDPEARAVLDAMAAAGAPAMHSLSVAGARRYLEELFTGDVEQEPVDEVRELLIPGPDGGDLPVRIYTPAGEGPWPVVVWFHGGGWVLGNLDSADAASRAVANAADCVVVSVDYRLAPEHPFPAGFEDCYTATEWVAENPAVVHGDGSLFVGGTSAGGNLAAAVALAIRDRDGPTLAGQILVYPVVNHPELAPMDSYEENAEGYFLTRADMEWFHDHYLARPADVRNPYAYPLLARDLSEVAPATVVTAGFDPLCDEGAAYAERLADAGVRVEHHHYAGMIHGFFSMLVDPELSSAREALAAVAADVRSMAGD